MTFLKTAGCCCISGILGQTQLFHFQKTCWLSEVWDASGCAGCCGNVSLRLVFCGTIKMTVAVSENAAVRDRSHQSSDPVEYFPLRHHSFFKEKISSYLCVCVLVGTCLTSLVGTKLWSSERTARALNPQAVSPAYLFIIAIF